MSNPQMIPMVSQDGSVGEIPSDRVTEAMQHGFRLGVKLQAPNGSVGIVPRDNIVKALQVPGMHVLQDSAMYGINNPSTPVKEQDNALGGLARIPGNIAGGVKALATAPFKNPVTGEVDLSNPALNLVGNLYVRPALESAEHVSNVAAQHGKSGTAIEAAGRAVAAVPGVGPWVMGTDEHKGLAERHSAAGILAEGLGTIVVGEGINQAVGAGVGAVKNATAPTLMDMRTRAVRATVPEANKLPNQAVFGAEKMFRAAAPTGANTEFRDALYTAAGDLAEIGRKTDLSKSSGGFAQPDMRPRAAVDAINDHLREMYQQEAAPQIERNAKNPINTSFGEDAQSGLEYLAKNAGTSADRALAQRALDSNSLPLADVNELRKATNRELAPLRGMSPQDLAVTEGNSRRFAGLKALDREVGDKIATELESKGEGGIRSYEQRYAALSQFHDQLERRVNAVELQRTNAVGRLAKGAIGGVKGIASASQAAVADVNIGRELQNGFKALADSGIQPFRTQGPNMPIDAVIRGAVKFGPVRGALPENASGPQITEQSGPTVSNRFRGEAPIKSAEVAFNARRKQRPGK